MNEDDKIIKRILQQRVLGYSADGQTTHWEDTVEYRDGSVGIVYQDEYSRDGITYSTPYSERRPYVARSQESVLEALSKIDR